MPRGVSRTEGVLDASERGAGAFEGCGCIQGVQVHSRGVGARLNNDKGAAISIQ